MGPLVAVGGLHVPDGALMTMERELDAICRECGFPQAERFKWSPGSELWMAANLVNDGRAEFFRRVLHVPVQHGARAFVVITDDRSSPATDSRTAELDAFRMWLERVELRLQRLGKEGVVIVDRPGGDRKAEGKFLGECADALQAGTSYVQHDRLALKILASSSQHVRLLQLADLITSCTLARVAGEMRFAPATFERVLPILHRDGDRVHGYGLKLHPDYKYANLYHWITKDKYYRRGNVGVPLPIALRAYSKGERTV